MSEWHSMRNWRGMRESDPPCRWEQDDDGNWDTLCGNKHILIDGTPAENKMRFCCYCGKEIGERKAN